MVITDHFTRYAQAYIMPKQTAPVVEKTLWDQFLGHYRWLTKILTDQGKSFENKLVKDYVLWHKYKSYVQCHIGHKQMDLVNTLITP